jgi:FtsH-binding integral membrane protein
LPVIIAGVLAVFALLAVAALGGAVFFSRTLKPRQRVVFWIGVVLAALYLVPQLYRGAQAGYRAGADIREQQGR